MQVGVEALSEEIMEAITICGGLSLEAGPGKQLELAQQDIAIRAIRHHDLTDKKLGYGDLDEYWEFKFAEELDDEQVLEQPWTLDQQVYIEQKDDCQVLIGPPGSGKLQAYGEL